MDLDRYECLVVLVYPQTRSSSQGKVVFLVWYGTCQVGLVAVDHIIRTLYQHVPAWWLVSSVKQYVDTLYLIFYLIGGMIAGLLQAFFYPNSSTPAIGASGAIAGVFGGYFLLYPRARVISLIPIFIFPWIVELPSLVYSDFGFLLAVFRSIRAFHAIRIRHGRYCMVGSHR